MEISVKENVRDVQRFLSRVQKRQIPFATALALTNTAKDSKSSLVDNIKFIFHMPTRFTLNSVYIVPARKRNFPLQSSVGLKDFAPKGIAAIDYLSPNIEGGQRKRKRSELHLMRKGYLPSNKRLVPSRFTRLNKFGNIPKNTMVKALSNLRAQNDPLQNTPTGKGVSYFYQTRGNVRGIWIRRGKTSKPFMVEVSRAGYRRIFKFNDIVIKVVDRRFNKHFVEAIDYALRTAK